MAASFQLSTDQRKTLAAICDAFIPSLTEADTAHIVRNHTGMLAAMPGAAVQHSLEKASADAVAFCQRPASAVGVPEACEKALSDHAPPDVTKELGLLLSAMSTRVGMLALCGVPSAFADLKLPDQEVALRGMATSMLAPKRKAFRALKNLITLKAFADVDNIGWDTIGYAGPESPEQLKQSLKTLGRSEYHFSMLNDTITSSVELHYDVAIVGSGCGGAVVAAELAQAGHRVLVIEKGGYVRRSELSAVEGEAMDRMMEQGGLTSTEDTAMPVMAGATFGGGSAINWACSLRTPDAVRQEWASEYGLTRFATDDFSRSLDTVCQRIGVKRDQIAHNRNNQLLIEGCHQCGYQIDDAPQAMADVSSGAQGAGAINVGDRYGIKQSMTETFLKDAATASVPAEFVDRCWVKKVLHRDGIAEGVEGEIIGADGRKHPITVRAPVVVSACGTINSPALLLRSGLPNSNAQIGKNLRLHPVSAVFGHVPVGSPEVSIWSGAPMTTVSNEGASGRANDGYGTRLECPSMHAGLSAFVLPWNGGSQFKECMLNLRRLSAFIVLTRDRGSGEVRLDAQGTPRLYYPLAQCDRDNMMDGLEKAAHAMAAAGIEEIGATNLPSMRTLPPPSMPQARAAAVEKFIADLKEAGFPLFKSSVFSAHQMGTCRMGSSSKNSVVNGDGQSWEISGLYVADASTFPTPSGVNPMVTTLAIAHSVAQQMKNKLGPRSRL